MPNILTISTGRVQSFIQSGQARQSGIVKTPKEGRVLIGKLGLEDDEQFEAVHGGQFQAVYSYAVEDYAWWSARLERALRHGMFGENLTSQGIDHDQIVCGERWQMGTALLEATSPRIPCATFQAHMGEEKWVERFNEGGRWGVYWRVIEVGEITAGDEAVFVSKPDVRIAIHEMARIRIFEVKRAAELLTLPTLSPNWRAWAERAAQ